MHWSPSERPPPAPGPPQSAVRFCGSAVSDTWCERGRIRRGRWSSSLSSVGCPGCGGKGPPPFDGPGLFQDANRAPTCEGHIPALLLTALSSGAQPRPVVLGWPWSQCSAEVQGLLDRPGGLPSTCEQHLSTVHPRPQGGGGYSLIPEPTCLSPW